MQQRAVGPIFAPVSSRFDAMPRDMNFYMRILIVLSFRYMNFMFDLEDASNDGTIDAKEFAEVCSCYGTAKSECEEAFAKMSKVRDGRFRLSPI